ncbi:hypothetical protein NDU88_001907, partial [Pleurodeles waltl]
EPFKFPSRAPARREARFRRRHQRQAPQSGRSPLNSLLGRRPGHPPEIFFVTPGSGIHISKIGTVSLSL